MDKLNFVVLIFIKEQLVKMIVQWKLGQKTQNLLLTQAARLNFSITLSYFSIK